MTMKIDPQVLSSRESLSPIWWACYHIRLTITFRESPLSPATSRRQDLVNRLFEPKQIPLFCQCGDKVAAGWSYTVEMKGKQPIISNVTLGKSRAQPELLAVTWGERRACTPDDTTARRARSTALWSLTHCINTLPCAQRRDLAEGELIWALLTQSWAPRDSAMTKPPVILTHRSSEEDTNQVDLAVQLPGIFWLGGLLVREHQPSGLKVSCCQKQGKLFEEDTATCRDLQLTMQDPRSWVTVPFITSEVKT